MDTISASSLFRTHFICKIGLELETIPFPSVSQVLTLPLLSITTAYFVLTLL